MGRIDNTRVILEELKMEKSNPDAAVGRIESLLSALEKAQQMKRDNDNEPLPPPDNDGFYIKFKNHLTLKQYLEIAKEVCPDYGQRFKLGYLRGFLFAETAKILNMIKKKNGAD